MVIVDQPTIPKRPTRKNKILTSPRQQNRTDDLPLSFTLILRVRLHHPRRTTRRCHGHGHSRGRTRTRRHRPWRIHAAATCLGNGESGTLGVDHKDVGTVDGVNLVARHGGRRARHVHAVVAEGSDDVLVEDGVRGREGDEVDELDAEGGGVRVN